MAKPGQLNKLLWSDFSKGIHVHADPGELPPVYIPQALNWSTVPGTPMVRKRFGAEPIVSMTSGTYVFYSQTLDRVFMQEGTTLARYTPSGSGAGMTLSSRTSVTTFGSSAKCSIVDFGGGIVIAHPLDGVATYDGTTYTVRDATLDGTALGVWQNKVWLAEGNTLYWSNRGDATTWTTATDTIALREIDDAPITCLGVGNGMDSEGRGGLLVFKQNSTHRVNDSTTGSYTTIDPSRGASGSESVASDRNYIYIANRHGIYRMPVGSDFMEDIHYPIYALWDQGAGYTASTSYVAWSSMGRLYFCNGFGRIYEWVPEHESWWLHSLQDATAERGVISACSFTKGSTSSTTMPLALIIDDSGADLLSMWPPSTGFDSLASPQMADYGTTAVPGTLRLPWLTFGHDLVRVRRAVFKGRSTGSLNFKVRYDYDSSLNWTRTAFNIGSGNMKYRTENSLGVARAIQFELTDTLSDYDDDLIDDLALGDTVRIPGATISGVQIDYVPLR